MTNYSRSQLIDALIGQYESFINDDLLDEGDSTLEEYIAYLKTQSYTVLVEETSIDENEFTLDDFMFAYS